MKKIFLGFFLLLFSACSSIVSGEMDSMGSSPDPTVTPPQDSPIDPFDDPPPEQPIVVLPKPSVKTFVDSLLDSSALRNSGNGITVKNGTWVSDGWKTTSDWDHIEFSPQKIFGKSTLTKGSVEFEVKGIHEEARYYSNQIFVMRDATVSSFRDNPFKCFIRIFGNCTPGQDEDCKINLWGVIGLRLNVDVKVITMEDGTEKEDGTEGKDIFESYLQASTSLSQLRNTEQNTILQGYEKYATAIHWEWDRNGKKDWMGTHSINSWYRFKVIWGNGQMRLIKSTLVGNVWEDLLVAYYDYSSSGKPYNPVEHKIQIGSGVYEVPTGLTYRNVVIQDLE